MSMSEAQHLLLHCTFISSCHIVAHVACDPPCQQEVTPPQYAAVLALQTWLLSIAMRLFDFQKHHSYNGNLHSEVLGDSETVLLHQGDGTALCACRAWSPWH